MSSEFLSPEEAHEVWGGEDDPDVYQVIAIDPGGTTGWAIFQVHPEAMEGDPELELFGKYGNVEWWTAGEFTGKQDNQIDEIVELVNSWPAARIVTEKFILRQMAAQLDPVEINAVLRWAIRPRYFIEQQPGLAMSTVTDDRQKDMGLWVPGKPHARDAVKHAVTFLKRQKERAVRAARVANGKNG